MATFVVAIIAFGSFTRYAWADPLPYASFSKSNWTVNEGDGSVTLTLTLSAPSAYPVTVQYKTQDGSAKSSGDSPDFVSATGSVTFAPGQTMAALPAITIIDDNVYEGPESFMVQITGATGAQVGNLPQAMVTITDNDPMPTVQFQWLEQQVNEDERQLVVPVVLSNPSAYQVSVGYGSADGTATSTGAIPDYMPVPPNSTLTFAPGIMRQTFIITVNPDDVSEENEDFTLSLTNPVGASLGSNATIAVTISDNSSFLNITATAGSPSPADPTVGQTVGISLTASAQSSISSWYTGTVVGPNWTRASSGSPSSAWAVKVLFHATDPSALALADPSAYSLSISQPGMPTSPDASLDFTPFAEGYWKLIPQAYVSYTVGTKLLTGEGTALLTLLQVGAPPPVGGPADDDPPVISTQPPPGATNLGEAFAAQSVGVAVHGILADLGCRE